MSTRAGFTKTPPGMEDKQGPNTSFTSVLGLGTSNYNMHFKSDLGERRMYRTAVCSFLVGSGV